MDNAWLKMMFKMSTRQPAHKLTNDDATDESLLWRHNDVIIGHSIAK